MCQEPKTEWDTPRVSPYRLAAHLTSAFAIYSGLLWTSLNMLYPVSSAALAPAVATAGASALRRAAHPLAALIGVTAVSGKPSCLQMYQLVTRCKSSLDDKLPCTSHVCMFGKQTFRAAANKQRFTCFILVSQTINSWTKGCRIESHCCSVAACMCAVC